MVEKYTFTKAERLTLKNSIDKLFLSGRSFNVFPVKFYWMLSDGDQHFPAQVLISVSKKKFKRAVDRNYIKRKIREAYRLNKHQLYDNLVRKNKKIFLALVYLDDKDISFEIIKNSISKGFKNLDSLIS